VVKSCQKDCPTASMLLVAKAAALHREWYQSSLSKLLTKEGGRGGEKERRQSDWLANLSDFLREIGGPSVPLFTK